MSEKQEKPFTESVGELCDLISQRIGNMKINTSEDNYIFVPFFEKAFKHYRAILLLCNNGFGQDAQIITRALLELYYLMKYHDKPVNKKDRKKQNTQFECRELIDRKTMLVNMQKDLHEEFPEHALNDIEKDISEIPKEIGSSETWEKTCYVMADSVGELRSYRYHYASLSTVVHTTPFGFRQYFDAAKQTFDFESSDLGVKYAIGYSTEIFLRIFLIFQKHFGLIKSREIKRFLADSKYASLISE